MVKQLYSFHFQFDLFGCRPGIPSINMSILQGIQVTRGHEKCNSTNIEMIEI